MNANSFLIRPIAFALVFVLVPGVVFGAEAKTLRIEHVVVHYDGITEAQALSLARVAQAARARALMRYGLDLPDLITVNVDCRIDNTVRLFTNGQDTYTLSVRTGFDLAPPAMCGIYNLYGMCHELGHVAMYRTLKLHGWLSANACEGWAHYFGSRVVDDVYAAERQQVWWMPYDYRSDGMMRLTSQLDDAPDDTVRAAGLWMDLVSIVGEKKMPALFAAWNEARIDPSDPTPAVLAALHEIVRDDAKIDAWWTRAKPVLLEPAPKRHRSTNPTVPPTTRPKPGGVAELWADDGQPVGKLSIAGSGQGVVLESPGEGYVLTAVKIYGSRYGAAQPPAEDFHVYLCDSDGKQLADFPFPYKSFTRGEERWVTLTLPKPQPLPARFILCVAFNPTATKGVYVHYDQSPDGDSRTGRPGDLNEPFRKGDWMIRAVVKQTKP